MDDNQSVGALSADRRLGSGALSNPAELRAYNPTFSEQVGNAFQDFLMALGAKPYPAGHVAHGIRDVLGLSPLGVPMAAGDLAHAKAEGDPVAAAAAAAGMIPGARGAGSFAKRVAASAEQEGAPRLFSSGGQAWREQAALTPTRPNTVDSIVPPLAPREDRGRHVFDPATNSYIRTPDAAIEDIPLSRTQEAQILGGMEDRMSRRRWFYDDLAKAMVRRGPPTP